MLICESLHVGGVTPVLLGAAELVAFLIGRGLGAERLNAWFELVPSLAKAFPIPSTVLAFSPMSLTRVISVSLLL